MKVWPRLASFRLLRELSNYTGDGIQQVFRRDFEKAADESKYIAADSAYKAISSMPDWDSIATACGQTVMTWLLKHEQLNRSESEISKLSFNLAKRLIREVRRLKQGKKKYEPVSTLYAAMEDLEFRNYREALRTLAAAIIILVTTTEKECLGCNFAKRQNTASAKCTVCGQLKCAYHCRCTAGSK